VTLPSFGQRVAILIMGLALFYALSYTEMRFVVGGGWSKKRARQLSTLWMPSALIMCVAILWYPEIQRAFGGWQWAPESLGVAVWGVFLWVRWRLLRARKAEEAPLRPFSERLREELHILPPGRMIWLLLICIWALASIIGTTVMLLRN